MFYSFVDLFSDVLGISVTSATTKKSDISDKFKGLADLIDKVILQVQGAASKAGINIEEAQAGGVGKAKKTLDELKEHVTSLQDLTNESVVVSGVSAQVQGAGSSEADVKEALKVLKGIVNADTNKDQGVVSNKETVSSNESTGGNVLKTSSGGGAAATAAAAQNASKVAVAGGIALRSLLKGGKLDAGAAAGDAMAVNGVGVSAANKLLSAIENIIKRVVKQCLNTF